MPETWICETCGTQYAPAARPPAACPICDDERQYVGWDGQRWTTPAALRRAHAIRFADEGGVTTLTMAPSFAIGHRAFLVPAGGSHVMWECLPLVTDAAIEAIEAAGGVRWIAISHPHFYAAMVEWSDALGGVPIYLHEADRAWVQRASPRVRWWAGPRCALADDVELVALPGHFPGSAGLWWKRGPRPGGSLFPGDALQVTMDRRHVTFMYSYPNAMPLAPAAVRGLRRTVDALAFDDVFGYACGRQILGGGQRAVADSFERYLGAIAEAAPAG
jgi:hypothetical protein